MAEATMLNFVLKLYESLESWEAKNIGKILNSIAMNVDETSIRVIKKNYWLHIYSSGDITLKFLHKKRGTEAINAINIIPRYSGIIIHDCWSPYLMYKNCDHALCGSHLVRELTYVIDSNNYKWAVYNVNYLGTSASINCKGLDLI